MCEIRLSLFRFWHLANEISHWWPSGSGSVVVIIISLSFSCVGVLHWYNTPAWTSDSGKYTCILLHYWLFCFPIIIFMFEILLTIKYVWLQTTQQTVLHNFKIVFFNPTKYKLWRSKNCFEFLKTRWKASGSGKCFHFLYISLHKDMSHVIIYIIKSGLVRWTERGVQQQFLLY